MSFREDSQLDPSQVSDQRGRGGFSGGRIAVGGGGLGVGGIIILLLLQFLGGGSGLGQLGDLQGETSGTQAAGSDLSDCRTGADANARQDCRILGHVNSVQAYWTQEFASRGRTYTPAVTYFETDQWDTGCGPASSTRSSPRTCRTSSCRRSCSRS